MKRYLIALIILICAITQIVSISSRNDNGITSKLWHSSFVGDVSHMEFPNPENSKEILVSSDNTVQMVLLSSQMVKFKKFFPNKTIISSNMKNILVTDTIDGTTYMFTHSGQLLSTIETKEDDSNFNVKAITSYKSNKSFNVFVSKGKIEVFNTEKVIYNSKYKEELQYLDFFADLSEEIVFFLARNNIEFSINSLSVKEMTKAKPEMIHKFEIKSNYDKFFIMKHNIFAITKEGKFTIYNYKGKNIKTGRIMLKGFNLEKSVFYQDKDNDILIIKGINEILFLSDKTHELKQSENQKCALSSLKLTCFDIYPKNNILSFISYSLTSNKFDSVSQSVEFKDDQLVSFTISPYEEDKFALASHDSISLYSLSISQSPLFTSSNSPRDIIFSELIAFSPIGMYSDKNITFNRPYTPIDSANQDNFGAIISNIFINLKEDSIQLSNSLKTLAQNVKEAIQRDKLFNELRYGKHIEIKEKENTNVKHSLFLYTKNNDLFVLNAFNGNILFTQKMKDKIKLKEINRKNNKDLIIRTKAELVVELVFSDEKDEDETISYLYNLEKNEMVKLHIDTQFNIVKFLKQNQKELISQSLKLPFINLSKKISSQPKTKRLFINETILSLEGHYSLYNFNNTIYCFKYFLNSNGEIIMSISYNIKFDEIIDYALPKLHQYPKATYLSEDKIFYKYLDSNIIFVLSKYQKKNLLITLLHGESGVIIDKRMIPNVDLKSVAFLFEDNWAIISYTKKERNLQRNEVFAIELLKMELEFSLIKMLERKFKTLQGMTYSKQIKNMYGDEITLLSRTFVLEHKVKKIFTSQSEFNNANKFIVVLLENNKVFLIDRRGFSPRRPIMKKVKGKPEFDKGENSIYVDKDLPGYQALIDLEYKYILDAEEKMTDVKDIAVAPTENESTFMLCAIGGDLQCYKVFPDKLYDRLSPNYSYSLILLFFFGIIIVTFVLRKYVKKEEFKNIYLNYNI